MIIKFQVLLILSSRHGLNIIMHIQNSLLVLFKTSREFRDLQLVMVLYNITIVAFLMGLLQILLDMLQFLRHFLTYDKGSPREKALNSQLRISLDLR